jgi:hypothetical protein
MRTFEFVVECLRQGLDEGDDLVEKTGVPVLLDQ